MDYFDNNFEDDFSSREELPEGFSWEEMKPAIYEKMDREKDTKKAWWVFPLGLLGLCLFAGLYFYANTTSLSKSDEISNENASHVSIHSSSKNTNDKSNATVNNEKSVSSQTTKALSKDIESLSLVNNSLSTPKLSEALSAEKLSQKNLAAETIGTVLKKQEGITLAKSSGSPINKSSSSPENVSKNTADIFATSFNQKSQKESNSISQKINKNSVAFLLDPILYSDDLSTRGMLSLELSPELSIQLKNKIHLNLGYQHTTLVEEFDYREFDRYKVNRPNELISTTVNAFTGGIVSEVRKDTFVIETRTRELLQYNEYKMHSLQIGGDYSFELGNRFSLRAGLGARYIFKLSGNGYRIYQAPNDAPDLRNDREPFSANKLGLNTSMRLNYDLGKVNAFFKIQGTKYLSNWEQISYHPKHSPLIYGVQLGLSLNLGK